MTRLSLLLIAGIACAPLASADSTINATKRYAHASNAGWINFRYDQPTSPEGVVFGEAFLSGKAYSANLGWIDFGDGSPVDKVAYQNNSTGDFGVNHDGEGNLGGYAFGANVGWTTLSTDPNRPRVNLATGAFSGFAYGANIGWINIGTGHLSTDEMQCIDTDTDGMDDAWEQSRFGDLITATETSDTDGDGRRDRDEYTAQSDPNDEHDFLDFLIHSLNDVATQMAVDFTSTPKRFYCLETSTNMSEPWVDAGLGMFRPDAGSQTSKSIHFPANTVRTFVRVRSVKPLQP